MAERVTIAANRAGRPAPARSETALTSQRHPTDPATPAPPRILFVNGFPRSGTTVMAAAVTTAVAGVTTTVGILARHIPTLAAFLERHPDDASDRGVDRLAVTEDTVEEYGYLLYGRTGARSLYGHPSGVEVLREHVAELTARAPGAVVVLKNPQDMGYEARVLRDFPDAAVLMLHRRLADIESSVERAMRRTVESGAYPRAVVSGGEDAQQRLARAMASRWRRTVLRLTVRLKLCYWVLRLTREVAALPPDRVGFLSYEELRDDAGAATTWAAHLVDPAALAEAYRRHTFQERSAPNPGGWLVRLLDRRWRRSWARARTAQVRAGICPPP